MRKRLEEEQSVSTGSAKENVFPVAGESAKDPVWNYWPAMKDEVIPPDYAADAITAANKIDPALNEAWTKSQNNTADVKPQEYAGGVVKRKDGTYESVNQKEGREGDSKPKIKNKDLNEGDVASGEYHTHPYSQENIALVSGEGKAYNWDGTGTGPSGGDFTSLAYQKLNDGFFSIVESGTTRSIIVVTDAKAFKAAFVKQGDQITTDMQFTIDDMIGKTLLDPVYGKSEDPKVKKNYADVYWVGLLRGLAEVKKENDGKDIGMKLLKSKPGNKSEYDTVYP
jgi:hypothetical protein